MQPWIDYPIKQYQITKISKPKKERWVTQTNPLLYGHHCTTSAKNIVLPF